MNETTNSYLKFTCFAHHTNGKKHKICVNSNAKRIFYLKKNIKDNGSKKGIINNYVFLT